MKTNIKGCYPAFITPSKKGDDVCNYPINYEGVDELLKYVLNRGIDGVVAGCTGSASLLSHDEQIELVRCVNENIPKKKGNT
ncbi:MAG: hypothetical protein DRP06_03020 [Candidatus Aenigmatarchaeota archaeon]|nr:MAG: hypothetical protein DRP06_03020 [Candidatus Aenigmarchaeota archaeon]